jgi:hypothetical protein
MPKHRIATGPRDKTAGPVEPSGGQPAPTAMARKLIFAGFILAFGLWLLVRPQFSEGLTRKDCTTVKGIVCVPKAR